MRSIEAFDSEDCAGSRRGRACGHEPDELRAGHADPERARFFIDSTDDLVQRGGLVVLDVHAHLGMAGPRQKQPKRAHAREPTTFLAHYCSNRARDLDVVRGQVDVERDQWPARADDDAARTLVEPRGSVVGTKLARVDAALELPRTSLPVERRSSCSCGLAVEEHGQPELRADPVREPQCAIPRALAVCRLEGDDRDDVCSADPGMSPVMIAEVDPLAGTGDAGQQRLDKRRVVADEREDRPVVIRVGMNVEDVGVRGESGPQRLDRPGVTSFREVRDRLERQLHRAYSTKV